MPESTLSLKYADLKAQAGLFLGWGRGADAGDATWDTRKSSILDEIVQSGLRQFYFPPPTDRSANSYQWSFLRPSAELTLAADADSIDLPDDFGGFDGTPSASLGGSGDIGLPLEITGLGRVRQLRGASPGETGRPGCAAVDPIKATSVTSGQRWRLEVFPTADAAYTLSCTYFVHPDALRGDRPYAYGGPQHAETIKASIIAAAELYLDDTATVRKAYFMERLTTSISQDSKMKPHMLGYNGDRSNDLYGNRRADRDGERRGVVTVYGVVQ